MKPSDKLIQTIQERQIRPTPRWRFALRNGLLWSAFALAVVLGALAFSIILLAVQQTDFRVLSHLSHSRLELFLGLLPFFWIVTLAMFLLAAMYSVQYSRKGYKITVFRLAGYCVALSVLLGVLFFIGGGAERLERVFALNVERYQSIQEKKIKIWSLPAQGFLSGTIEQTDAGRLRLRDFNEKIWTVDFHDAFVAPVVLLERGEIVKLVGKMTGEDEFAAAEIRPWGGPGGPGGRGRRAGIENEK